MAASTTRTVKAKFDGDAKGLIAAAAEGERAVDRFGKDTEKKFNRSGDRAAKSFGRSIRKWFGGAGGLKEIGDSGGTVFGSGFLGALKTPVLGPAIAGILAGAVAVGLPAVGAIAAGGLVAGFGAGLAGLGIVFAAKSDAVKKKWQQTTAAMGADMQLFAKPYEKTLIRAADVADRTFDRFAPSLKRSFAETAPIVSRFIEDLGDGLEELEPAVQPLSTAFQSVLRSLGPAMQSALRNVSSGLQQLAESVRKNPDALADTVAGVGQLTNKILGLLGTLNDVNGQFKTLTGGTSLVTAVFRGLEAALWPVLVPFQGLSIAMGTINGWTKPVGAGFQYTATSAQEAATATGYWTQGLTQAQIAAMGITGTTKTAGKAVEDLTTKYNRQKAATDALIQSTFRYQGLALGLAGAEISYQAAVDAATASVKENGRTLDINSEKGRNNKSALLAVAQAANQQTQSMIESGKGTAAAGRSAEAARSNFSRVAQQMGLSKREADRLARALIAIPPNKTSKVSVTGAEAAKQKADAVANAVRLIPGYKNIQIKYTSTGIPTNVIGSEGRRASGGLMQPNRRYLVGERRPELVEMGPNGGARVVSGEQTPTELAGGDNRPIINEIHIEIGGEVVRVVRSEIRTDKRETKRKVGAR